MKKSLIIAIASITLFIFISEQVAVHGIITQADKPINLMMTGLQTEPFISLSKVIHYSFEILPLLLLAAIISLLFWLNKRKLNAIMLMTGVGLSSMLLFFLKLFFKSSRPINALVTENNFSYPSGHVLISIVLFGLLIFFYWKSFSKSKKILVSIPYIALIITIAFSRLYLNVHWLSDIFGSITLGSFFLFTTIYLYNLISRRGTFK
jgi:undecaprenyl-diphosphatase